MNEEKYIRRCYKLAVQAGRKGFDTFGAVLVHNGRFLRKLKTQRTGKKDFLAMRSSTWFTSARTAIRIPC